MKKAVFAAALAAALPGISGCESMFEANPQKSANLLSSLSCGSGNLYYNDKKVEPNKPTRMQAAADCQRSKTPQTAAGSKTNQVK